VPPQDARHGIIQLQVNEAKVGRLRVKGSRFFSLADIKRRVPSLAEGKVPNFNDIQREIVALNNLPDRRVTPDLKPGVEPGTVDIDLNVKDTFPLHGSLELNNRHSANTTELRLAGSLSYNNLWQLGHSVGFSFNVAPERPEDATILSAYYMVRFPNVPWLSVNLHGTKQESDIVVPQGLTGLQVVSPGETIGVSATLTLPGLDGFYHSVTFGFDYKRYEEDTIFGLVRTTTPITYYPASVSYDAAWFGKGRMTELGATATYHHRGLGSDPREFDTKRYKATGSFFKLQGELAHTQELPLGAQVHARVHGQAASQPLINTEQIAGGGLDSVRGYLESEVLGDNGLFGTLELRSPSLLGWWDKESKDNDWRIYGFFDVGYLTINHPLPEEISRWNFASYGFGSQLRLFDCLNGSLDAGLPLISQGQTLAGDLRLTFRVWADF
jgi:hemolysin activation/secretion protein